MVAKPTRVAVYLRVSTDKQDDSPERQLSLILPYIQAKGYVVVGQHYVDLNQKGWREDRPAFQRLLQDAQSGKFDIVLVDQGSRLSRQTPTDFFALVAYPLLKSNVQVESVQRGRTLDWNDIGDFLVQSVEQYRNNSESVDTSWRVLSEWCLKASRADLHLGRPPYGYRKVRTPDGRTTLVPGDEQQVRVVQYIFDAYGRLGLSLAEVCEELNRRGAAPARGGKSWRQSTLARWLRDPIYIGTFRFNQVHYGKFYRRTKEGLKESDRSGKRSERNPVEDWIVVPDSHPPLVDKELFYRVQEVLQQNRRRTTPGRNRRDFLLAGLLVCGKCGCRMTGTHRMRAGSKKSYGVAYRCASSYDAGRCKMNIVAEDAVTPAILAAIEGWLNPECLTDLRERARRAVERACRTDSLEPLLAEREKLNKQIDRARRNLSLLENDEDVRAVGQDIGKWRERLAEVDAVLGEAEKPRALSLLDEAIRQVEACLWELREARQAGDQKLLRAVLRRLVDRVELNIEPECIGNNRHRYHLRGGVVHLVPGSPLAGEVPSGLLNLSSAGPTTVQVSTWSCSLSPGPPLQ